MARVGVSYSGDFIGHWLDKLSRPIDCLEVVAEDFYKRNHHYLDSLATRCPLTVRAGSLSLGTPGPLHHERLTWLAEVVAIAHSSHVVHPLGFSHTDEMELGRSIPISFNASSLAVVAEHVAEVMRTCRTPLLIQNMAAALRVPGTIAESEFLNRLCELTGCRLLVDVTALLVESRNHRFDPRSWLEDLESNWIVGAHIAGCSVRDGRWQDAHHGPIDEQAWALIDALVQHGRPDTLIIEVQAASGGIDRLELDIERLRLIAGNGTPDVACHATKSLGVQRRPPAQRRRAPRPSAALTRGTSGRVNVAADACLYVLDCEGVFFSESRQEVYLFNTAATLIWYLLEQDLSLDAVIDAYRDAFGLARSEAAAHVGALLQQWFGLGYICDPALPVAPDIPLTTALARLLTNSRLRSEFRESPQTMAVALRVGAADVDSFLSLEPDELDRQADEIAELRSVRRYGGPGGATTPRTTAIAVDPDLLETGLRVRARNSSLDRARCYRLLTTTFRIRVPSDRLDGDLHSALAHLHAATQMADVTIDVGPADGGWIVFEGTMPVKYCRAVDEVVPVVKQMLREISADRSRFLIKIHAAAVLLQAGSVVLMPGAAGSGKTTLTAALLRSGVRYLSDEVALLEEATLRVRPVPLALTIKQGSVEPLDRLYPELAALPQHTREDRQQVRYLPPPLESLFDDGEAHQIRCIVFPRYDPTIQTALVPLERPSGLKQLLAESLVLPDLLDRGKVEALVRWMRDVQCFELPMSSLGTAVDLVRSLD